MLSPAGFIWSCVSQQLSPRKWHVGALSVVAVQRAPRCLRCQTLNKNLLFSLLAPQVFMTSSRVSLIKKP